MTETVFIIGAGPGLSLGLAKTFGAQKKQKPEGEQEPKRRKIVLFARNAQHLAERVNELRAEGIEADFVCADCTDSSSLAQGIRGALDKFGAPELVIYNTCNITPDTTLLADAAHWPQRFMGDVGGLLVAMQTLAADRAFMEKKGAVIATGGTAGLNQGLPGYLSLSVDKAALRMLVQRLHDEFAPLGIFVGVVQIHTVIRWDGGIGDPMRISAAFADMAQKREDWEVIYGVGTD